MLCEFMRERFTSEQDDILQLRQTTHKEGRRED